MSYENLATERLLAERDALAVESVTIFHEWSDKHNGTPDSLPADDRNRTVENGKRIMEINNELRNRPGVGQLTELRRKGIPTYAPGNETREQRETRAHVAESERLDREQRAWSDDLRATEQRTGVRVYGGLNHGGNSAEFDSVADEFRSAILERNPKPIEIAPDTSRSFYNPGVEMRERRDLMKLGGTGVQALPTSVYGSIVEHLVEQSAVLRAGATVINTDTGEDLVVPKSSGYATSAIVGEGGLIPESDPTLGTVTLKSYKYSHYFEMSTELATDSTTNLMEWIARAAATSVALKYGDDLINGDGVGKPRGILLDAGIGLTGPVGTATGFGSQTTAGQGTDTMWDLYGSLAEPYVQRGSTAWVMRTATKVALNKIRDNTGQPVALPPVMDRTYVDPFVAAPAANAKSVIFGDFSTYFVRFAGPIRFESTNAFKFQNDLISFRVALRLDAALVDANGLKVFRHSAT